MFHARKALLLVFLWLYKGQRGGAVSPGSVSLCVKEFSIMNGNALDLLSPVGTTSPMWLLSI